MKLTLLNSRYVSKCERASSWEGRIREAALPWIRRGVLVHCLHTGSQLGLPPQERQEGFIEQQPLPLLLPPAVTRIINGTAMGMVHSKGRSTAPCTAPCTASRQELRAGGKKGILPQQTLPCCPKCSGAVQVQRFSLPKSAKEGGDEAFSSLALTQQEGGSVRKQFFSPQNKQQAGLFCHMSKEEQPGS